MRRPLTKEELPVGWPVRFVRHACTHAGRLGKVVSSGRPTPFVEVQLLDGRVVMSLPCVLRIAWDRMGMDGSLE